MFVPLVDLCPKCQEPLTEHLRVMVTVRETYSASKMVSPGVFQADDQTPLLTQTHKDIPITVWCKNCDYRFLKPRYDEVTGEVIL
jgi:hypothetical protein